MLGSEREGIGLQGEVAVVFGSRWKFNAVFLCLFKAAALNYGGLNRPTLEDKQMESVFCYSFQNVDDEYVSTFIYIFASTLNTSRKVEGSSKINEQSQLVLLWLAPHAFALTP